MITEKEYERLRRDRNLYQMENTRLNKKLLMMEDNYNRLLKRDKVLEMVEKYLPDRISKLIDFKEYSTAVIELQSLSDALSYERKKIDNEDEETEEL